MSKLFHETPDILIQKIFKDGLLYSGRNEGIYYHEETEILNEVINKHRPDNIRLDRNKCVFFSFKRDYIKYGHKNNGIIVESDDLEQEKLYVFSNTICSAIMWSIRNDGVDLEKHVESYWNSMIPFQYYDKHYREIELQWKEMCRNQGLNEFEYGAEVLYFENVPPHLIQRNLLK